MIEKINDFEIAKLKENPKNPKEHTEKQIKAIAESIKKFGFTQPILVDENNVILAGHGRTEALKKLGIKKETLWRLLAKKRKNYGK